ncbi:hypothetical protein GV828_10155 [Flavobacterium sp. NST-5]|uniref:Lipoprotein n=1 Tax=Flavobacterium ichthyis TaxID=2698827 RepID=A0ABW9ZFL7_9FLAO|nr:hypothetical protein [Flavobacterium ichthyis]NBL65563.1 hypothetical protein [Flavobacterium ichthyis]
MKKILVFLGLFFMLLGCDSDKDIVDNSAIGSEKSLSRSKASSNKVIEEFAKTHVELSNEILLLMNEEQNLNFDEFPYAELEGSSDRKKIELALAETGMINHEKIFGLLNKQIENAKALQTEQFMSMDAEEREKLIVDAIETELIKNPIDFPVFPVPENSVLARTCSQQYAIDREDCANEALINWGILFGGCWFGTPAACAVGGVGVLAIAANCSSQAKRDYRDCLNGN